MKFKIFEDWSVVFFIMIILVSTISGIKYFDSQEVFDAQILKQNQNGQYSIDLQIENKIGTQLDFEVETIYKRGNLVLDTKSIRCDSTCDSNILIDKIFFDKYDIIIKTFFEGRGYQKKLSFKFDKEKSQFSAKVQKEISWESGDLIIPIELKSETPTELSKYVLDIFPTNRPEIRSSYIYECQNDCSETFIISRAILFGEYTINIYSQKDILKLNFNVVSESLPNIPTKPEPTTLTPTGKNQTPKQSENKTQSNLEQSLEELNIIETIVNTSSAKLVRNYTQILNELELESKQNISKVITDSKQNLNGKIIAIDLGGNEVELDNISEVLENKKFTAIITKEESKSERPEQIQLKPIIQNVNELIEIENLTLREISITEKLQQNDQTALLFQPSSFGAKNIEPVSKQIIGKEEKILEQTSRGFERTDLTLEKLQNKDTHKLVPGIYKKEERTLFADGSEEIKEEYFAYGLITVNTVKPLYKKGELVEMKIVVLDAGGYLVSDAKIDLEITKPSGQSQILSTTDNQIIESNHSGVYTTQIYANELGNYNLYAQVEQYDIIVDVETYFNVVEDNKIPFQIIRNVPATIDPWLGPFNNTFMVSAESYSGFYNFTEVFSSDFTNISTNADLIETTEDLIYLTWNNLIGTRNNLTYSAQVPLVTPYLYELGKSFVNYENKTFFEDRPWLFAIDPVAKICSPTDPTPNKCVCTICGSGDGGDEPGHGTIDSCADTNTGYEYVSNIIVESLNSSYFGTGDTVRITGVYDCDSSGNGDRVSLGYMGAPRTTWVNGDILQEWQCDVSDVREFNTTVVLGPTPGVHYVRGKLVWSFSRPANTICDSTTYADHDDMAFEVLNKTGPTWQSWTLDNGTNAGNNLNVIRGNDINFTVNWNLPLQSGQIRTNGPGAQTWFDVDSYDNNKTLFIHKTSNITRYPNLGPITSNRAKASDFYFDIETTYTTGNRQFYLYGITSVIDSILTPYVSNTGTQSNFSCRVQDENVGVDYSNVNITFKIDGSLIGTALTNSTGWAKINYTPVTIGQFNLTCEIVDELAKYYLASNTNNIDSKILDVKPPGADINPPTIFNIYNSSPLIIPAGNQFNSHANYSDDLSLKEIFMSVKIPSGSTNLITYSAYTNLLAYWDFDRINASYLIGYSPNNYVGEFKNGISFSSTSGIRNQYGIFDGTDDYVQINDNNIIGGISELSGAMWIKLDNLNGDGSLLTQDNWGAGSTILFWRDDAGSHESRDNTLGILINTMGGTVRAEAATNSLNDNDWHHVAFTYKENSIGGLKLYIDGILDVNSESTIGRTTIDSSVNPLLIGKSLDNQARLDGQLEDIWLFNKSLLDWEIQNLFNHNSILNLSYDFGYTGTSEFGNYEYFYGAYDISDNYGFSAKYNFETKGIDGYLDTKIDKSNYKLGQIISFQTPSFVTNSNLTLISELGDVGYFSYNFDSTLESWTLDGTGTNTWVRGNDADCPNQPCIATTLNGNYGNSGSDQRIQSPILDFSGRTSISMTYYRVMNVPGTSDTASVEVFDGSTWNRYYQNTQGGNSLPGGTQTIYPGGVDNNPSSRLRFRIESSGGNAEGWRVDDINITFNPRVEWSNDWIEYNTAFGANEQVSAIEFSVNITTYDNTGSTAKGNNNPDLEVEFYNGTGYSHTQTCGLNSGLTYPTQCKFILGSQDEFLTAWNTTTERRIRIRAINMDKDDSINFKDVERTYAKPSLVKNYGILPIDAYLVHNLINSTGSIVQKLLKIPVSIAVNTYTDLSLNNVTLSPLLELGNYTLHTAVEDNLGSVFISESDGSKIENKINITLGGLKLNISSPIPDAEYFSSAFLNVTPDTTLIASGGWCGYSLNGNTTQDLTPDGLSFTKTLSQDGDYNITFYCNDTDGDIIPSNTIDFKIFTIFKRDTSVTKTVTSISSDTFLVNVTVTNLENETLDKSISEFIPSDFIESNLSVPFNYTSSITGLMNGKILTWEFQLNNSQIKSFTYNIQGTGDFRKRDILKTSLD